MPKTILFAPLLLATLLGAFPLSAEEIGTPLVAARKRPPRESVGEEEEIDLSAEPPASSAATAPANPHGGGTSAEPHFSTLFDLLLAYRPGPGREGLSFLNFHPLLFFDIHPLKPLHFSFEVNFNNPSSPSSRYYELDYQPNRTVLIRVGRIWIPFDEMSPHNLFGGLVNTSRLAFGNTPYLPDIWADLGAAVRLSPVHTKQLEIDTHLYVVNGFNSTGGTSPLPNFSQNLGSDNNDNKSIGARVHFLIGQRVGLGASFYTGRWSNQQDEVAPLTIFGGDAQLLFSSTEFHAGLSLMNVSYASGASFQRSAYYLEGQQKFGAAQEFRAVVRLGNQDTNSTVVDDSDNTVLGGGLRWKPNFIGLALEHYQDLKEVPGKTAYGITFLRMSIQL